MMFLFPPAELSITPIYYRRYRTGRIKTPDDGSESLVG